MQSSRTVTCMPSRHLAGLVNWTWHVQEKDISKRWVAKPDGTFSCNLQEHIAATAWTYMDLTLIRLRKMSKLAPEDLS